MIQLRSIVIYTGLIFSQSKHSNLQATLHLFLWLVRSSECTLGFWKKKIKPLFRYSLIKLDVTWTYVKRQRAKMKLLSSVKGVSFLRNCGAALVGVLQDNLVLSTELTM